MAEGRLRQWRARPDERWPGASQDMSNMPSDFDGSVLAIVKQPESEPAELLGTGFVVSPNVLISCAHVFEDTEICDGRTQLPGSIVVLCGDAELRPTHAEMSASLDLCCLHFDAIPGAVPLRLARSRQLKGIEVTAVGYVSDHTGPRRNVTHRLEVIHDLQSDRSGQLQHGQLGAGLHEGFSGGPVLARTKNGWVALGLLQLGSKYSATSNFIAVDPIAAFLNEQSVEVTTDEFEPEPERAQEKASAPPGKIEQSQSQNITVGGSIENSTFNPVQNQTIKKG